MRSAEEGAADSSMTWGQLVGVTAVTYDQLKHVQRMQASRHAFAAILGNASVVTWGDADFGGDSSALRDQLKYSE